MFKDDLNINYLRFNFRVWDVERKSYKYVFDLTDFSSEILYTLKGLQWEDDNGYMQRNIIEQSIGLEDSQKKLIYEGDILSDEKHGGVLGPFFIGYCEKEGQFQPMVYVGKEKYCHSCNGDFNWIDIIDKDMDIIGNIHENMDIFDD